MLLTSDEILSEPAGKRLDAWVAEHVMGWRPLALSRDFDGNFFPEDAPNYSTDIAAAWQVVEKMRADGWHYSIGSLPGGIIRVNFSFTTSSGFEEIELTGNSIPELICRVALWGKQKGTTAPK